MTPLAPLAEEDWRVWWRAGMRLAMLAAVAERDCVAPRIASRRCLESRVWRLVAAAAARALRCGRAGMAPGPVAGDSGRASVAK